MEGATLKKETIETKHEEFIHDVAFDFYGDRVATCSSDFSICIFGSSDGGDKTKLSGHIKSHEGPVWRISRKPLPINENEKTEEVTGEELRIFGISGAKITPIINLHSSKGHNGSIKDVAWAPQNGKTYHTIASCADDSKVIIWRFDTGNDEGNFGSK